MLSYVVLCTVAAEEAVAFADVYVYREDFDVYAAKLHNSSGISCRFPEKSSRKRTVELHFCDFSQPTMGLTPNPDVMCNRLKLTDTALSSIYLISVSAVQHRKQNLKKEGFGVTDPSVTFDQVIAAF